MDKRCTYEQIEELVNAETYSVNCEKLNCILDDGSNVDSLEECAQLDNFYYVIIISKKYNQRYSEVINLINKYQKIQNYFDVKYYQFYFLKTTEERVQLIRNIEIDDIYFACRLLSKIIKDSKVKDITIYKKMYCDFSLEVASSREDDAYRKIDYVQRSLKLSKELNATSLYKKLIKVDRNLKSQILKTMKSMEIELPPEVNEELNFIENKIRKCFQLISPAEIFVKVFVNPFYIKVGEKSYVFCLSKNKTGLEKNEQNHFVDLVSWTTFDGDKTVKSNKIDGMVEEFVRKIIIKVVINPIIEGGVSKLGKREIINFITSSYFVFEEDKEDLEIALNFYFNGDYRSFIYYIIPNIEKVLRNMLEVNGVASYQNSSSNPQYQTTFVLTDSLKKLKDEAILDEELVQFLNEKLNDSEHENYRNRLAHKLDKKIFCHDCASDLLRVLIVILFCYEIDSENVFVVGDDKEIEEIISAIENKRKKIRV